MLGNAWLALVSFPKRSNSILFWEVPAARTISMIDGDDTWSMSMLADKSKRAEGYIRKIKVLLCHEIRESFSIIKLIFLFSAYKVTENMILLDMLTLVIRGTDFTSRFLNVATSKISKKMKSSFFFASPPLYAYPSETISIILSVK